MSRPAASEWSSRFSPVRPALAGSRRHARTFCVGPGRRLALSLLRQIVPPNSSTAILQGPRSTLRARVADLVKPCPSKKGRQMQFAVARTRAQHPRLHVVVRGDPRRLTRGTATVFPPGHCHGRILGSALLKQVANATADEARQINPGARLQGLILWARPRSTWHAIRGTGDAPRKPR